MTEEDYLYDSCPLGPNVDAQMFNDGSVLFGRYHKTTRRTFHLSSDEVEALMAYVRECDNLRAQMEDLGA